MELMHRGRIVAVALVLAAAQAALAASHADSAKKPASGQPAAREKKRMPPVKGEVKLKAAAAAKEALPKVAHVRLSGLVLSSPPDFSLFSDLHTQMTLRDWLERLGKARNDQRVQAVALEVDAVGMNWSQAQELADAIQRLNKSKPVYAHITAGGALPYLLASAAREVTMDAGGTLVITGLGAELMFYRGTLNWLGIRPQLIQIGRYKGAAEPFTRTGPSNELKGEYNRLLDDLYEQLCGQIARQRRLTVPHVRQAVDEGPLHAEKAREYRLVDRLVPKTEWSDYVRRKVAGKKHKEATWLAHYGRKAGKKVDFSNPLQLFGLLFSRRPAGEVREPTIAIVHANGMIVSGKSGQGFFGTRMVGSKTMMECFREVEDNDKIKAVILRINSPGGSALASDLIYQAARRCAKKKPVIASIAGLGASGGYYIALGGQKILADPAAITGSVGVVSGKLALTGLMDKIGISTYEITRGRNAGLRMSRPWNEREQEVIRKLATRTYDRFVSRVRESRGGRIKDVGAVTQGRIFTARLAAKNGLIDGVGGLREALMAAQGAAKIKSCYIITLPKPKTLLDMLYGESMTISPPAGAGEALLGRLVGQGTAMPTGHSGRLAGPAYLLDLARLLGTESALTALPYHVSVRP